MAVLPKSGCAVARLPGGRQNARIATIFTGNCGSMSIKTCWTVTDGRAGMLNQAQGLAEELARTEPGGNMIVSHRIIDVRAPWRWLPPALWHAPLQKLTGNSDPLRPPWPDVVIGCGRLTVPLVMAIARQARGAGTGTGNCFTVQLQDPRVDPGHYDLVVPPRHDHLDGPNVFQTTGAVHRVTAARLETGADSFRAALDHLPHPRIAVLIGGSNKYYRLTPAVMRQLADRLKGLTTMHGAGLMVTTSRRTGVENEKALRAALADTATVFWDGQGDNPYFAYLGLADEIVVTCDSVSMCSEAASTGKPVHVVQLEGGSAKFNEFHANMRHQGHTRIFDGNLPDWQPVRLDDTALVAAEVRRRLETRTTDKTSA